MTTERYTAMKGSTLENPFFRMTLELAVINAIKKANTIAKIELIFFYYKKQTS